MKSPRSIEFLVPRNVFIAVILAIIVGNFGHGYLFLVILIMTIGGTQFTKNKSRIEELQRDREYALKHLRTYTDFVVTELRNNRGPISEDVLTWLRKDETKVQAISDEIARLRSL